MPTGRPQPASRTPAARRPPRQLGLASPTASRSPTALTSPQATQHTSTKPSSPATTTLTKAFASPDAQTTHAAARERKTTIFSAHSTKSHPGHIKGRSRVARARERDGRAKAALQLQKLGTRCGSGRGACAEGGEGRPNGRALAQRRAEGDLAAAKASWRPRRGARRPKGPPAPLLPTRPGSPAFFSRSGTQLTRLGPAV